MSSTIIATAGFLAALALWFLTRHEEPGEFEIHEEELNEAIRTTGIAKTRESLDVAENMERVR